MDPGIGHEIEADLQAHGYPILWGQYLPTDPDLTIAYYLTQSSASVMERKKQRLTGPGPLC